jgi:hypothetical protein
MQPVRRAAAPSDRLAAGNLGVRMPERGVGEIGVLERSFNLMAGSLEQSREELAASRARIVAAGDRARRRIEPDLHDGTQQRLVSLVRNLARRSLVPVRLQVGMEGGCPTGSRRWAGRPGPTAPPVREPGSRSTCRSATALPASRHDKMPARQEP